MAGSPLTPKQIEETRKALERARGNKSEAARILGIPNSTMQSRQRILAMYEQQGSVPRARMTRDEVLAVGVATFQQHGTVSEIQYRQLAEQPQTYRAYWDSWTAFRDEACRVAGINTEPRFEQRQRDQQARLKAELTEARRALNAAEDIRETVFRLAQQPIEPPEWTVKLDKAGKSPGAPLLFTSDFQWGERVVADELDGVNSFDLKIARSRYRKLIEKTLELLFKHEPNPNYPGLIYVRGGDMISGDIHQELRETNLGASIPQVVDLVEHEAAGIRELRKHFRRVHVVSVPGNHGRQSEKPTHKGFVLNNYDTLSAYMLEREFKNDKGVTWLTPVSGDALFKVFGWQVVVSHGDRIGSSGGAGFIGALAPVLRGMQKVSAYYASLRTIVDLQLIGHFHTSAALPWGYSNGCLPGYSEYAKSIRAKVAPPSQWLLTIHPHHMVSRAWEVHLDKRPAAPVNAHLPWLGEAA